VAGTECNERVRREVLHAKGDVDSCKRHRGDVVMPVTWDETRDQIRRCSERSRRPKVRLDERVEFVAWPIDGMRRRVWNLGHCFNAERRGFPVPPRGRVIEHLDIVASEGLSQLGTHMRIGVVDDGPRESDSVTEWQSTRSPERAVDAAPVALGRS